MTDRGSACPSPVIVGVGEINDRPGPDEPGFDAVELMAEALRRADRDAGGGWLGRADRLAITPQISFRDHDVPARLQQLLGIAPAQVMQAAIPDGDVPIRHIDEAANAIAAGEATICLLAGGEAVRTAARRRAAAGRDETLFSGSLARASDIRKRYGLINPADLYPLYENATRAAWGQTLAEGQAESAMIWSILSQVAAESEGAWIRQPRPPEDIITFGADNRPLAFPYSKLQVANSSVNQGAALIVTSLALAEAAGLDPARLVHVGAGASAHEDDDPLMRAAFTGTPGMEAALNGAMTRNDLTADQLDHVELYPCFPCVPKMARRLLGLPADRPLSVHGGLTFGGGPIGNYMMHAAAAMVRKLRAGGCHGLLYGNGGHCTHNHALVLSSRPTTTIRPQDHRIQADADARRGVIPPITDAYEGNATIETYTVFHDRAGMPTRGVIIARNPANERVVAQVDAHDLDTIGLLTSGETEPVGTGGITVRQRDTLHWHRLGSTLQNG